MSTLRIYIFAFLLIILSAGNVIAQSFKANETTSDSIFKNQNIKITLTNLSEVANEDSYNTIVGFLKLTNGKYIEVFKDSVYSKVQKVEFEDFNNDNVKDILIQNISDARSNWTYNLYLIDTADNSFKKVKGFEEIKNPKYLPKYNLIESYVLSGKNWLSFYKIEDYSIKQFDFVVKDELDNSDKFERDYEKAIQKILAIEKKKY